MALETKVVSQSQAADGSPGIIQTGNYDFKSFQIEGTFSATWAIQVRNGTAWVEFATGTGATFQNLTLDSKEARLLISSYSSGTVEASWFLRG